MINNFTAEFINDFCINGEIDWQKLVRFNSEKKVAVPKKVATPKKKSPKKIKR